MRTSPHAEKVRQRRGAGDTVLPPLCVASFARNGMECGPHGRQADTDSDRIVCKNNEHPSGARMGRTDSGRGVGKLAFSQFVNETDGIRTRRPALSPECPDAYRQASDRWLEQFRRNHTNSVCFVQESGQRQFPHSMPGIRFSPAHCLVQHSVHEDAWTPVRISRCLRRPFNQSPYHYLTKASGSTQRTCRRARQCLGLEGFRSQRIICQISPSRTPSIAFALITSLLSREAGVVAAARYDAVSKPTTCTPPVGGVHVEQQAEHATG